MNFLISDTSRGMLGEEWGLGSMRVVVVVSDSTFEVEFWWEA